MARHGRPHGQDLTGTGGMFSAETPIGGSKDMMLVGGFKHGFYFP